MTHWTWSYYTVRRASRWYLRKICLDAGCSMGALSLSLVIGSFLHSVSPARIFWLDPYQLATFFGRFRDWFNYLPQTLSMDSKIFSQSDGGRSYKTSAYYINRIDFGILRSLLSLCCRFCHKVSYANRPLELSSPSVQQVKQVGEPERYRWGGCAAR